MKRLLILLAVAAALLFTAQFARAGFMDLLQPDPYYQEQEMSLKTLTHIYHIHGGTLGESEMGQIQGSEGGESRDPFGDPFIGPESPFIRWIRLSP